MAMKIKGTVATRVNERGRPTTSPLIVLREYLSWGLTPEHWGDSRACELAVAVQWALRHIPSEIKKKQEKIEKKAWKLR